MTDFPCLFLFFLPCACFVFRTYFISNNRRGLANYSAFSGYAMIATFIMTSMGFKQLSGFVYYAGLLQRLCISIGLTWMTLISIHLIKNQLDPSSN